MIIEKTSRLVLGAGNLDLISAEMNDRAALAARLEAIIPAEWPTEALREALPIFQGLYRDHPDWEGWLHWYALLLGGDAPVLCGSIGFKGPPDENGTVETGYSVLPAYQEMGIASEMLAGILRFAARYSTVRSVIAETEQANIASQHVLARNGFKVEGPGSEHGIIRYIYHTASIASR